MGVVISRALGPWLVPPMVLRLIVSPDRLPLNVILSRFGAALAAWIAARRLPGPESLRLVTLNVDGTVRSSSTSRFSRQLRAGGRADRLLRRPQRQLANHAREPRFAIRRVLQGCDKRRLGSPRATTKSAQRWAMTDHEPWA